MGRNRFLVLLFVAGLAIKVPLALSVSSFGVDESIYLATARNFAETGEFGINSGVYNFQFIAPVFTVFLAAFYWIGGDSGTLLVSPIFSSLTVVALYFLGQRVGGDKIGRMSALVGFFASVLFLLASRPLTESTALFFFTASLVAAHDALYSKNNRMAQIVLPPLLALTFLARFQYGFLLGAFLVAIGAYEILRNGKLQLDWNLVIGALVALAAISPWALLNMSNYGTPLGGAAHQAGTDVGFDLSAAIFYVPYSFIIVGLFVPFMAYGKYLAFKEKNAFLLLSLGAVFAAQFFVFGKIVEERYALPILPAAAVLAAIGFYGFRKRFGNMASLAMLSLMLVSAVAGYGAYSLYQGYDRYEETKAAVIFMKENCSPPVMSNSFAQIWNYWEPGLENIPVQPDLYKSLEKAGERSVTCILFSRYESPRTDVFEGTPYVDRVFNIGGVSVYRLRV